MLIVTDLHISFAIHDKNIVIMLLIIKIVCRSLGMEQTLLDLLGGTPTDSVVELTMQYRMNEEIMRLSNQLIYNNRLQCGTESIRTNTVQCGGDLTVSVVALYLYNQILYRW